MTATQAAWHFALFYENQSEYVDGVLRFVRDALDAERPVLVAVPPANGELLRDTLDGSVAFADMSELGRNPSRIIPAIRKFIDTHADQPVSFVGEPIWAGRTRAEIAEATRHEALINTAFEDAGADVLCPYDVSALDPTVLADAFRTHPELLDPRGNRRISDQYDEPRIVWQDCARLPPIPRGAERFTVRADELGRLRQRVETIAAAAQLPAARIDDLQIAVTELAANSIRHGGGIAEVAVWAETGRICCNVRDNGIVDDPLVGRRAPRTDLPSGRGLWLVNQLCDLVQLHSSAAGTTVRIMVGRN